MFVVRPRPRRALRPPLAVRVLGWRYRRSWSVSLGVGVTAATWPGDSRRSPIPRRPSTSRLPPIASPATPRAEPAAYGHARARPPSQRTQRRRPSPRRCQASRSPSPNRSRADPAAEGDRQQVRHRRPQRPDRSPSFESDVVDVVSTGAKVSVTSAVHYGFRFISYKGQGRWISNKYLSDQEAGGAVLRSGSGSGISSASVPGELRNGVRADSGRHPGAPGPLRALPAGQLLRRSPSRQRRLPRHRPGGGRDDLELLGGLGYRQLDPGQRLRGSG